MDRICKQHFEVNEMENFKKGETVLVKAVVDRAADENHKLLRLVTEKGTVLWASPEEVIRNQSK